MNKKILRKSFIIVLLISVCLVGLNSAFAVDANISSEGSDLQVSEISNEDAFDLQNQDLAISEESVVDVSAGEVANVESKDEVFNDPVEDVIFDENSLNNIVSDDISSTNSADLSSSNSIEDSVSNYGAAYVGPGNVPDPLALPYLDLAVNGNNRTNTYYNPEVYFANIPISISGNGHVIFDYPSFDYFSYYDPTGGYHILTDPGATILQNPAITYKVYQYFGMPSSNDFLVYTETTNKPFNINHMFNPGNYYVVADMESMTNSFTYEDKMHWIFFVSTAISSALSKTHYFNIMPFDEKTLIPVTTDKNQYYSGDNVLISGSLNLMGPPMSGGFGSNERFNINLHVFSDSYNKNFNVMTDGFVDWNQWVLGNYSQVISDQLLPGHYSVSAEFYGQMGYFSSHNITEFDVLDPIGSNIDIFVDNSLSFVNDENKVFGSLFDQNGRPIDNADIIVNIFDAFGNLVFENNNSSIANSNNYELIFRNLTAGNYTAVATYLGTNLIKGSNASCNFEILPLSSSIDVFTDKISYYEDEIIEVSGLLFNAITGNVIDGANVLITLTDNNNAVLTQVVAVTDAFGNYYYNFTNLYSDEYNVLAEFIGNSSIIGSNSNTDFDVITNLPVVPEIPNGTDPVIPNPVIPNGTNITENITNETNETEDVNETPVVPEDPVVPVTPVVPSVPEEPFVANANESSNNTGVTPVVPGSNNPDGSNVVSNNINSIVNNIVSNNGSVNLGLNNAVALNSVEESNNDVSVNDNEASNIESDLTNNQNNSNNPQNSQVANDPNINIEYNKLIDMKNDNSWATLFMGLVGVAGLTEVKRRREDEEDE